MGPRVYMGHIVLVGGHRISRESPGFTLEHGRARLDGTVQEDKAETYELGLFSTTMECPNSLANDTADKRWLTELNTDPKPTLPVIAFMEPGNPAANQDAVCIDGCTPGVKWQRDHGQLAMYDLKLIQNDRLFLAKVMFSAFGTAGVSALTNGPSINLGNLGATQELHLWYAVSNFPAVVGTTPGFTGRLESSALGDFTDAVTRQVLDASDGTPKGFHYVIDGAVTPVTAAAWRIKFLAPTGTGTPTFWPVAAATIETKIAT